MSLAGDQHRVGRGGGGDGGADGGAPIRLHPNLDPIGDAGANIGDDPRGGLGTGVIAGHHHRIGEAGGNGAHQRPLAGIPIATATEHAPEPTDAVASQGQQSLLEGVGGVGVVDHHLGRDAAVDDFHAPADGAQCGHPVQHVVEVVALGTGGGHHRQQVGEIERTEQGTAQHPLSPGADHPGTEAALAVGDIHSPHPGHGPKSVGENLDAGRQVSEQLTPEPVVGVDHRMAQPRPLEQPGLGGAVGLQGAVVIEMVAAKIGEDGGIEGQCRDPVLVETVGRHLHGHHPGPLVDEAGEDRLGGDGIRGRHPGGRETRRPGGHQTVTQGAHYGGTLPQQLQQLTEQVAAGGLAVGAGDGGDPQAGGGFTVEAPGDGTEFPVQIRHPYQGHGQGGCDQGIETAVFGNHRHTAPPDGFRNVAPAVVAATGQREKNIPRRAAAAVEAQTGDDHIRRETQVRQQVGKARGEIGGAGGHHRRSPLTGAAAVRKSWPATCSSDTASGGTLNSLRASAVTLA